MATMEDASMENVLKNIARHINCLSDENRNVRKRALEGITKETLKLEEPLSPDVLQTILYNSLLKSYLKLFSDPVEKCRQLALNYVDNCLQIIDNKHGLLPHVIPVMVQRLGQKDINESSEEIRLSLIQILHRIINNSSKHVAPYLDDIVVILQHTIVDPYPEVKKESCKTASSLAKAIPAQFHMQSESLVQPLMTSISHQHSRVRVDVITTIGDIIQYGNNKSVDDVTSHLAQRLFDQAPTVRAAVTSVVGNWLLDLMDRYSFHHKLIPLLLTSMTDDVVDIQTQAEALWHDIGLKYESENENDLKDKQDFMKPDPEHYPEAIDRPNLGCRTLVYRHMSKILPGLLRDLDDWVAATRIKSAQLLYTLMLNNEENITQHMEKLLTALYRACHDEQKEVVQYVLKCGNLIGYFVSPEVWCKMVLEAVRNTQSSGSVMMLSAIVKGSNAGKLKPYLEDITNVLANDHVCRVLDLSVQQPLLSCVQSVIAVSSIESLHNVSFDLFTVCITVLSLHRHESLIEEVESVMVDLCKALEFSSVQELYNQYTGRLVDQLQEKHHMWTIHDSSRHVFHTLLLKSGTAVGDVLDRVVPILISNLQIEKEPELKLKMFTLLSQLVMGAPRPENEQEETAVNKSFLSSHAVTIVNEMILPNCVWQAGRTAGAVRLTAITCLWTLLQNGVLSREMLKKTEDGITTRLHSLLDDDNKSTRILVCRAFRLFFLTLGSDIDQDRLHNMYPDFLKRLDDNSDEVRVAAARAFQAHFGCFEDFQVSLYRAHLESIYQGLLVHLDDQEATIQQAILDVLETSASLCPSMLLEEIDQVRHKHRNTVYLDKLTAYIHDLPKPN